MNNFQSVSIARVYRGNAVESVHWGSIAVVNAEGRLMYRVGDPYVSTFTRSSAKPFQAIAVIESGAAKKYGFTTKELAIMCGSHSGERSHVETVAGILEKIGLNESHLQCGIHVPHRYMAVNMTPEPGVLFSQLEHNCSGKHAGMLAVAVHKGYSLEDYLALDHPVQLMIRKATSEICNCPEEKISLGIDGCSAPNFAMPLYNMALGYARLVTPNSVPKEKALVYGAIYRAMMEYPEMVGGTARFDTIIAKSPGEPLVSKAGAEAVHCFAFVDRHLGAAIKITDGARRALYPVAIEFLYKMGMRSKTALFADFHRPIVTNWRDIEVGHIEPGFQIEEVKHD